MGKNEKFSGKYVVNVPQLRNDGTYEALCRAAVGCAAWPHVSASSWIRAEEEIHLRIKMRRTD